MNIRFLLPVLSLLALSACSSGASPGAPAPSSAPAVDAARTALVTLMELQEVERLLGQGMVQDGYVSQDVTTALEGVEVVLDEIDAYTTALERIEFPEEVQPVVEDVLALSSEEERTLRGALDATSMEEFDEAWSEYLSLPLDAYGELREALGIGEEDIYPIPAGETVYTDDFSDEENAWEVFADDFASARYVSEEFELTGVVGSYASSAPTNVHDFNRSEVLLSVDTEVVEGSGDDSYSYGVTCPAESPLDDGVHAELLGSGGYTFYRTLSSDPELLQYYTLSPDPLGSYNPSGGNRLDVLCSSVEGRTVVRLWLNGVYVDGTSFPFELPTGEVGNGDGALTNTVNPDASSGMAVRFDNWSVTEVSVQ